jgi:hypothetical protein
LRTSWLTVGMYSFEDVVTRQRLAGDDAPANRPRNGSKGLAPVNGAELGENPYPRGSLRVVAHSQITKRQLQ